MTENEAISRMRYRVDTATHIIGKGVDGKAYEDMEMAIKALEEIQQYRAIGAVEECREAREKQIPKKPIHDGLYACPNCHTSMLQGTFEARGKCCKECGQVLDWSETD